MGSSTQESYDCVVWPISESIEPNQPLNVLQLTEASAQKIFATDSISLSRSHDSQQLEQHALYFSHGLMRKGCSSDYSVPVSLSRRLKNSLTLEQKIFIKEKIDALRTLFSFPSLKHTAVSNSLAYAKSWPAEFIRPASQLNIDRQTEQRIPVLIACHWLELGGAEKFAIDLIQSLPKQHYAIYVTTDIASMNPWIKTIEDHVEAIFQLPAFLTCEHFAEFYDYLISSRQIQLMHIHHAAKAYESLYHIRRFHPDLKILDSLHIIELPPNEGGYVDASARDFEAFIDHHHVISHFLQDFLMQRWHVPEYKISRCYLNVDVDYFNPKNVEAGCFKKQHPLPENCLIIGFLGRFSDQKQPLEFIKLAECLIKRSQQQSLNQPLVFFMAGSGLLKDKIESTIASLADIPIYLFPEVDDARLFYKDCDLLMMPSKNEGLALVSYEAMAMETPIFMTHVGAQSELLDTEFLIDPTTKLSEGFSEAMWPFLIDTQKRIETGKKMRQYILKNHSHQQTFEQMHALYHQLLAKPGTSTDA